MILDSIKPVINDGLKHVTIHEEKIPEFVKEYGADIAEFDISRWLELMPKKMSWPEIVTTTCIFNAINFCYWPDKDNEYRWTVRHAGTGEDLTSSEALFYQIAKLVSEEPTLTKNSTFLFVLNEEEKLRKILSGNGEIPLLKDRFWILCTTGQAMLHKSFYSLYAKARDKKAPYCL